MYIYKLVSSYEFTTTVKLRYNGLHCTYIQIMYIFGKKLYVYQFLVDSRIFSVK